MSLRSVMSVARNNSAGVASGFGSCSTAIVAVAATPWSPTNTGSASSSLIRWAMTCARRRVGLVLDQHPELVAVEPGDGGLLVGEHLAQPCRDRLQQPVADLAAEPVVDRVEAVEVDVHDRELGGRVLAGQGFLELSFEPLPVGEPGQRVVNGLEPQLALEVVALRHVLDGRDVVARRAVRVAQHRRRQEDQRLLAVALHELAALAERQRALVVVERLVTQPEVAVVLLREDRPRGR